MKRFVFKLESVRRLREQEEQAVQVELARVIRERDNIHAQISDSKQAETKLYDYLRQPGHRAGEYAHIARYGSLHRERIHSLSIKLRQFDAAVEQTRARLSEARAKHEALCKLREQQKEAWQKELQRVEQEELDEIATLRYSRESGALI